MLPFKYGFDLLIFTIAPCSRRVSRSIKQVHRRRVCRCHTKFKKPRSHRRHTKYRTRQDIFNGWGSYSDSPPHWGELLQCFIRPPRVCTREHAFDLLWEEVNWERLLNGFLHSHDPSDIMSAMSMSYLPTLASNFDEGVISTRLQRIFISSIDSPRCLSGSIIHSNIIIDTGASVCISPHRSDFLTYHSSQMRIKDLSSSNKVQGEGIIRWKMQDANGHPVDIELLGYHIPSADVRLLSPQVLFDTFGGQGIMTGSGIDFVLSDGNRFSANLCPRSNLPLIPLALHPSRNFWNEAFGYTLPNVQAIQGVKSLLSQYNTNLSSPQKELLLWHQRLSHASLDWIQMLMRDRKYLSATNADSSLHSGPFIKTKSRAPVCDASKLKCSACLCAKATVCLPSDQSPRPSQKKLILKTNHLLPGDCVSADHYFSPIQGRLLHTFGRERTGYTCGSLFVDHASGKIFNFPQFSPNATETIRTAQRLESMAREEGFNIKSYHADNGIFFFCGFQRSLRM